MRPQITAINHYDVFPFNNGGSMAVLGLEKGLSTWFDINLIAFVSNLSYPDKIKISDHITVYPVLVPEELLERQRDFYDAYGMNKDTIFDSSIVIMRFYHENPYIIEKVRQIGKDSVLFIAEHVYTWKIIKAAFPDKPAFYRAHNVEYDYKMGTYRAIGMPKDLLQETYEFEKACCLEADHVLTVSKLEADRFMELYEFPESMSDKFTDIHLGYEADKKTFVQPSKREKPEGNYKYFGFFISSDMPSALDAARICIEAARKNPELKIFIVGRIWRLLQNEKDIPENVKITGLVTDEEKRYYLSHCDFAMNPVESGAGVNVKMFEYYAYGIPVIATAYGARGTGLRDGIEGVIASPENYSDAVMNYCRMPLEKKDELAENAFALLEREFSWKSIAEKTAKLAEKLFDINYKNSELSDEETGLYPVIQDEAYLPKKKFYIRCAGNNGVKCLKFLRSKELEPAAFVENNPSKVGTTVEGIKVISLEEFLLLPDDSEIVVAVWTWMKVTYDLIARGVSDERISVSWGDNGYDIFHLSDMVGSMPAYHDRLKLKKEVHDYYRIAEGVDTEKILKKIRQGIEEKNLSVKDKHLASVYYQKRIDDIRKEEQIVIVGAGVYAKRLYDLLTEEGLSSKVACLCDNNAEMREFNPLKIKALSVEEAKERYPEALFVITPRFYENEIMWQLGKLGVSCGRIMIFTFAYTGLVD